MEKSAEQQLIESGDRYMVQWRNGQWHIGDIVGIRPIKRIREDSSSSSSGAAVKSLKNDENEFYIHYPGFDRRLDEWVTLERVDLQTQLGDKDQADAPVHGNHKSKKMKRMKTDDSTATAAAGESKKDSKEGTHSHTHTLYLYTMHYTLPGIV